MDQVTGDQTQVPVVPPAPIPPPPIPPGQVPPVQPMVGSVQKEQLVIPAKPQEKVALKEVSEDMELEPAVEGWVEQMKEEREISLLQPVTDDHGQVVLANAPSVTQDKIVVPLTSQGMVQGLKRSVTDGARWLAEWVKRLRQMFGDRVVFKR
ncbi:hypothetical protein A2W24_06285 [Microgenomates group bacterium RBG_16_45_19]|nr:MAG: hypothetical protein A2W24_06285 [Microgenomates group bacterium RBG_16_45_19]